MKPLYIFDLDGTLALIEHRRHFVEGHKKDWPAFFAACVDDVPNLPVIRTLQALRAGGAEIWIWSGRSDEVKAQTVEWLCKHGCMGNNPTGFLPARPFGAPERFRMRKAGDHQPDTQLKASWLDEIEPPEYKRLTAAFDDRDSVVQMWRDAGVTCFQVAPAQIAPAVQQTPESIFMESAEPEAVATAGDEGGWPFPNDPPGTVQ